MQLHLPLSLHLQQHDGRPSKGDCIFALAFHVDQGRYGAVSLDGLSFAVIGRTPAAMGEGHWSVGVIVDERATQEQRDAFAASVMPTLNGFGTDGWDICQVLEYRNDDDYEPPEDLEDGAWLVLPKRRATAP